MAGEKNVLIYDFGGKYCYLWWKTTLFILNKQKSG
jgi:hypothetical protein